MSRFFHQRYADLIPYVPGEQPQERKFVKLNTNESPYPPSKRAVAAAKAEAERLELYSDPTAKKLCEAFAQTVGVSPDEVMATNGSDEILNFAFMAYCGKDHPAVFPDITYGFYPVFANLNGIPYTEIPLRDDFTVDVDGLCGTPGTVFLANPNAPTGIALPVSEIEKVLQAHPNDIVVIDEAYVDFGGESCVRLIPKYENLLVTQTFSKSRSMAGARLGFGIGQAALIADLQTLRNSTNPYNVNRMTMAAGIGALADEEYTEGNCKTVIRTRERTAEELKRIGFRVLPSKTNFLFAKHPAIGGYELYRALYDRGVLVRHFNTPKLKDYNRITVGSPEQMEELLRNLKEILEENK